MPDKVRAAVVRAMKAEASRVNLRDLVGLVDQVEHALPGPHWCPSGVLEGVHLTEPEPGVLRVVACDGHRLAQRSARVADLEIGFPVCGVTVSPSSVSRLSRSRGRAVPAVVTRDGDLLTVIGGALVVFDVTREPYPGTTRVIPSGPATWSVDRSALAEVCDGAEREALLRFVGPSGEVVRATLDTRFLAEALGALDGDALDLWLPGDPTGRFAMSEAGRPDRLEVIMPRRPLMGLSPVDVRVVEKGDV